MRTRGTVLRRCSALAQIDRPSRLRPYYDGYAGLLPAGTSLGGGAWGSSARSSSAAPLFRTLSTAGETGQSRSTSSPAVRMRQAVRPPPRQPQGSPPAEASGRRVRPDGYERGRPDDAAAEFATAARPYRPGVRRAVPAVGPGRLRLPRLPRAIHRLIYKRASHEDFHVHGFMEEGSTTTPFDMVVVNRLDRFRLAAEAVARVPRLEQDAGYFEQGIRERLIETSASCASTDATCRRSKSGAGLRTETAAPGMLIRTGADRPDEADRHLALLLAGTAGALNTAGFYAAGLYSSNMTGNVSAMAEQLGLAELGRAPVYLALIFTFVAGSVTSTLLINAGHRRRVAGIYAFNILTEAVLLAGLGCAAFWWEGDGRERLLAYGLSFAMGLQNAIVTRLSGARVRTTHVTGMLTDIGIELGNIVSAGPDGRRGPEADRNRANLRLHGWTVLSFLAGGRRRCDRLPAARRVAPDHRGSRAAVHLAQGHPHRAPLERAAAGAVMRQVKDGRNLLEPRAGQAE